MLLRIQLFLINTGDPLLPVPACELLIALGNRQLL
jgi:hypothetical protein